MMKNLIKYLPVLLIFISCREAGVYRDRSVGTNSPGQSGDPESRFYQNLFVPWARDEYFPVYFSRNKIYSVAVEKIKLVPENKKR
jgi:acyl-homoserine lactone acylase PvdQ